MQPISGINQLPQQLIRSEYHRIRVLKPGDPPKYLYSSDSNARFDLIHLSISGTYAEYYLYAPGSLFNYNFDEELMVMKHEGKWIAHYTGKRFWEEQFSIQGGNTQHD